MDLNQPTLIQFENVRKENKFIPSEGSNSFYKIGDGEINLLTLRSDPDDCRFDLFTNQGHIYTGVGNFIISGDIVDPDNPYNSLTVIAATQLSVTNIFSVSKGNMDIHGTFELMRYSKLYIRNNAHVTLYTDSIFIVNDESEIHIEEGSSLTIYGEVDIHLNMVDSLLNVNGVTIDSAAVMNVDGIDDQDRKYSMTKYETELREKMINMYTQGEVNFDDCRMGYTWTSGSPLDHAQVIDMSVLYGEAILGDFKLSALGTPDEIIPNLQMISNIHVNKNCTLYISERYGESHYIRPELYLGIVIGNNKVPADCIVDGTIMVDGKNSVLTVDRGATIHINSTGLVRIKNDAIFRSTYNDNNPVLFIDGTLMIDTIDQIDTFEHDNIILGETGKVIILNPDTGVRKLLWTTPDGINDTLLYKLFSDRITHVEYHISNNSGIAIDKYYDFYNINMTNWYGGMRIEKAVHEGLIVWHDGGFIELNKDIIPWVSTDCTLYDIAKLFKVFSSFQKEQLQECADKLKYAGFGNIIFRFIDGNSVSEITLNLESINMISAIKNPYTSMYEVTTDNDGMLFVRNNVKNLSSSTVISDDSIVFDINDKQTEFSIDQT